MLSKIQVFIITGFLGSGKTTFLNKLLPVFGEEKNVIIENEFGKINVDASLISGSFDTIFELTNGCICCSINNQLLETLLKISGLAERPTNLFIETTGIADVGDIASTFKNTQVAELYNLQKVICLVDAENFHHYADKNIEIHKQIVSADCVLITKTTEINNNEVINIEQTVKSINPFAQIAKSASAVLKKECLLEANNRLYIDENIDTQAENKHKINSLFFETKKAFDIQKLKYELHKTLFLHYNQIFRIKGYVLDKNNNVYLVQSVGKTTSITVVNNTNIKRSQLIFIGIISELKTVERILKPSITNINITNVHLIS